MNKSATAQCARAVSLFRGLYARVARNLGVDVSYISRIARGQRKSRLADKALEKEFYRVLSVLDSNSAFRRTRAKRLRLEIPPEKRGGLKGSKQHWLGVYLPEFEIPTFFVVVD